MKRTIILIVFTLSIIACNKKHNPIPLVKDTYFDKAESFLSKNSDSAFYYFNKVAANSRDSLEIAIAYNQMAVIESNAGDYFGAQESLMISLKFLNDKKEKHFNCLSSDYNELGLNVQNFKNFDLAIEYYDKAEKYSNNKVFNLMILNNKALVYQKTKKYAQAIKIYNEIITGTGESQKEYARALSNVTKTKWLQNPDYKAAPYFLKALDIRKKQNDIWGQNASYSHLTDYYTTIRPDSALIYAHRWYQVTKEIKSPDDQIDALRKLIQLSPPVETKAYFKTYQKLDDSLKFARNSAKNQFALIRYEVEKNKSDNLKLQKDNTEKKYQIIKQRILLFSTFLLLIGGSGISIIWYKKRKQRLEMEAQNTVRENKLKTSKKVHDVVANGLYRVMTEIENQESLDRNSILDKLENMYEKSRDISYEELGFTDQNFHVKLSDLLRSFATETIRIVLVGNTADLWLKVSIQIKIEIEHILQELMVNMSKHSKASNVAVKFEQTNNCINIYYSDNGIGIAEEEQFKNGLTNTGTRIKSIHGEINFGIKAEKGLKVQISFPVS
ncbi:histidine kinase [Pedobacter lusitanus]|uniref:Contig17, whole genome shotgun sequence n=1 Tax=Pedobacter lusitanus TaxID=1503925 RepID=A0A0D0G0E0_9SPHI|nr:tetratricopeptide repeat-containing sensor histidine kinase [Pedobacter lusitanus]KIO78254.1 histidine kinase [Pedobacter lusitanus]